MESVVDGQGRLKRAREYLIGPGTVREGQGVVKECLEGWIGQCRVGKGPGSVREGQGVLERSRSVRKGQ